MSNFSNFLYQSLLGFIAVNCCLGFYTKQKFPSPTSPFISSFPGPYFINCTKISTFYSTNRNFNSSNFNLPVNVTNGVNVCEIVPIKIVKLYYLCFVVSKLASYVVVWWSTGPQLCSTKPVLVLEMRKGGPTSLRRPVRPPGF